MTTPHSPNPDPGRPGITVQCAKCQSPLWFDASSAGRRAKCQTCGAILRVPALLSGREDSQDPKLATTGTPTKHARHGVLSAWAQIGATLVAVAGLTLALYQHYGRANVKPARWEQLDTGFAVAEERLRWYREAFGDTEKDIRAYQERMEDTGRRTAILVEELKQIESNVQGLVNETKSLLERAEATDRSINAITGFVNNTPKEDRVIIGFGMENGTVRLPDRMAGSAKMSEITVRRTGDDIIISCLLNSPIKDISLGLAGGRSRSGVTASDGTTIEVRSVNVGKTGWYWMLGSWDLHPGVPLSVQWKLPVPSHHDVFSLIELVLIIEGVAETVSYRNVAVP